MIKVPNIIDSPRPFGVAVPGWFKRFRLKEWQAFQFGDERWFFFTALYNAKAFGLVIAYGYDRVEKREVGFRKIFPGAGLGTPGSLFGGAFEWSSGKERIRYDLDAGNGSIGVSLSWKRPKESFQGSFSFSCGPGVSMPCSVCLPFNPTRAMYSTKLLMPMKGSFTLNGAAYDFDSKAASGILDDHKGFYPHIMTYDWVTGFGFDGVGRRIGFNLTKNQVERQERFNENVLWIDGAMYPLPPVHITRPRGAENEWIIQDFEGMVDMTFKPEVHHRIKTNALIMSSDYDGPFGSFSGVLAPKGLNPISIDSLYGMGEKKLLRA